MKKITLCASILFFALTLTSSPAYSGFKISRVFSGIKKTTTRVAKEIERGGRRVGKNVKVLDTVGRSFIRIYKKECQTVLFFSKFMPYEAVNSTGLLFHVIIGGYLLL